MATTPNQPSVKVNLKRSMALFTPEMIEAQSRANREYLTTRVKLLLEAKQAHPSASFDDLAKLAECSGQGCCCCCPPGTCCGAFVGGIELEDPIEQVTHG